MSPVHFVHLLVIDAALGVPTTSAQTQPAAAALTHVEGAVYLDDQSVGSLPRDVVLRDAATVRTTDGRAVLALKRGGVLALAEHTFDVEPTLADGGVAWRFRVYDGAAAVPLISVTSALRSGQAMKLDPRCGDMIPTETFAPEQLDDFDRWSRQYSSGSPR